MIICDSQYLVPFANTFCQLLCLPLFPAPLSLPLRFFGSTKECPVACSKLGKETQKPQLRGVKL